MKKRWINLVLASALCFSLAGLNAQTSLDLNSPVPVDSLVRTGVLPNGLTYYIRKNANPEHRVMLRLAINAGSVNESDAQVGLAHFTEHMLFNGTKNFPKNELVDFLQKTGMRFGGDINAFTSFNQTVYMLEIPTDKPGLLDDGYQVLEDWAHQVSFDADQIDGERGVIIEERRSGLGADDRMNREAFPILFKNSMYAKRLPIGTLENLKTFKHETLKKYYKDFYRPDLQAVVVVGDVDLDQAEAKVKAHFGPIKNPKNEVARQSFPVPDNKEPLVAITTDKEATSTTILLAYKHPKRIVKTLGDYRNYLVGELASNMFEARYSELSQDPNSPITWAGEGDGNLFGIIQPYMMYCQVKGDNIKPALSLVLSETQRVERYGFLQSELDRAKDAMLKGLETQAKEYDKSTSMDLSDEYVGNFTEKTPMMGSVNEFRNASALIKGITIEDVSKSAQDGIIDSNILVWVSAPLSPSIKVPTEKEILDILATANTLKVDPYVDHVNNAPLVSLAPKTSQGVSVIATDTALGLTTLELSNGIQVVLKPSNFKNDEILFGAYALGGNSLISDDKILDSKLAANLIESSGKGDFTYSELTKKLQSSSLNYNPYISGERSGIRASSTPADFETLLQYNYLNFTGIKKDTAAFASFMSNYSDQIAKQGASPQYCFYDTVNRLWNSNSPRIFLLPSQKQIASVNLDDIYNIYTDQFGDPSNYKFYIVGNFTIDDNFKALLNTYIGSLAVKNTKRTFVNRPSDFPKNAINITYKKGNDPKGMVVLAYQSPIKWSAQERANLSALEEVIDIKMIEVIREKMGGVYSPSVNIKMEAIPSPLMDLTIMFGCDPAREDQLVDAVNVELAKILKNGPTAQDIEKVKELRTRSYQKGIMRNGYWLNSLMFMSYSNLDNNNIQADVFNKITDGITVKSVHAVAKKYLNLKKCVRVNLVPVAAEQPAPATK